MEEAGGAEIRIINRNIFWVFGLGNLNSFAFSAFSVISVVKSSVFDGSFS